MLLTAVVCSLDVRSANVYTSGINITITERRVIVPPKTIKGPTQARQILPYLTYVLYLCSA